MSISRKGAENAERRTHGCIHAEILDIYWEYKQQKKALKSRGFPIGYIKQMTIEQDFFNMMMGVHLKIARMNQ
jgi:hypothetical protein